MTEKREPYIATRKIQHMAVAESGDRIFNRERAWQLLCEWTQTENLRKHAQAVEICVTAYGEAEADRLGLTGDERTNLLELSPPAALLPDFDDERHRATQEHPFVGFRELEHRGGQKEMRR